MEKQITKVTFAGESSIFHIDNDELDSESQLFTYGRASVGALEIYASEMGAFLESISCPYSNNIIEMDMHFPEPEEMDITEDAFVHFYPPEGREKNDCGDFQIAFTDKEMDIVLSNNSNVGRVCRSGRVEFYSTEDDELLYIRVKNLTPEEYEFLQSQKKKSQHTTYEQELIKDVEEKEDVSVVQASVIGSRGWKYEDENSDIDLRFVYVRKPEDYFRMKKQEDNLTYPIEDKKDLAGYELGKFLRMICAQNPMAYEILNSPAQLMDNEHIQRIKQFSNKVLQPSRMVATYQHVVASKIDELQHKSSDNVKLFIYILRMLGTINYLQSNQQYPACQLESLFSDESNAHLRDIVNQLVEYKKKGLKTISIDPDTILFLTHEVEKTRQKGKSSQTAINPDLMEREASEIYYGIVHSLPQKQSKQEMESFFQPEPAVDEASKQRVVG